MSELLNAMKEDIALEVDCRMAKIQHYTVCVLQRLFCFVIRPTLLLKAGLSTTDY